MAEVKQKNVQVVVIFCFVIIPDRTVLSRRLAHSNFDS